MRLSQYRAYVKATGAVDHNHEAKRELLKFLLLV